MAVITAHMDSILMKNRTKCCHIWHEL